MKRRIAFFDFDGTITSKDTLLENIKFQKGLFSFYFGFFINAPYLIAYKLKIISNQAAKQRILKFFFGKMPLHSFQMKCDDFASDVLPSLILPRALEEIERLKSIGTEVVIVSASAENWIQKWSDANGIKVISTKLEVKDGIITGNIEGRNCHGKEKVRRILAAYDLSQYDEIYGYGDTKSDKPMLSLAHFAFYKFF